MRVCTAVLLAVMAVNPGSAHDARESRYVGLQVVTIPLSARIRDGLASTHPGVELVGVDPGSPADGARLQQQDLIERANGRLPCSAKTS